MVIKARNPAEFAEEYIVESIWKNRFPPGSILPAERELSELIGVTRTTLREVLQRLARDGWLTIQHGKPTQVNNFWETSGLNILMTLARLDEDGVPELVDHLLSARTNISAIYIRAAIKHNPQQVKEALHELAAVPEEGSAFADFDYRLNHSLAKASGNPIYVLVLNGFKTMYSRIGKFFFCYPDARQLARNFYHELERLTEAGKHDEAVLAVRRYGMESGKLWHQYRAEMPADIVDK